MSLDIDCKQCYCALTTDWGNIVLQYNNNRLLSIYPMFFAKYCTYGNEFMLNSNLVDNLVPNPKPICDWLSAFFTEKSKQTISQAALLSQPIQTMLPIDLYKTRFTPFQSSVMKALSEVSFGSTVTYMEIAKSISSNAARAVGSVMARNPFPIVYPCHRVLASGGKLGGFAGGLKVKIKLLEWEKNDGAFV